jgi:hypothetical protein
VDLVELLACLRERSGGVPIAVVQSAESLTLRVGEATMTIWPTEDAGSFTAAFPHLGTKRNGRTRVD